MGANVDGNVSVTAGSWLVLTEILGGLEGAVWFLRVSVGGVVVL